MKAKLGVLLLLIVTGCHKNVIPADIPEPIKAKIEVFRTSNLLCDNASVNEHLFQNARVYSFSDGTCVADGGSSIYDAKGNSLCYLGGLIGNTTCNGESFSKATFLRTIWKK